jgi:agmatine deiminase
MPDESAPHQRTWMAFGASAAIWGRDLLPAVQHNLMAIAQAIAHFEPVTLLVRPQERAIAQTLLNRQPTPYPIDLLECPLDDLWIRDTGPVFVVKTQPDQVQPEVQPEVQPDQVQPDQVQPDQVQPEVQPDKAALDFNFNGWGRKQTHRRDAQVARFVARQAGVPVIATPLTLEGGSIEVDGQGTAILTESCILNPNRNPGLSKTDCEAILKPLLGLTKIIWLPGIAGQDITDGHTDFYARFAAPGTVIAANDPDPASFDHAVTQEHLNILRAATDAHGRSLNIAVLTTPTTIRNTWANDDFAAGYVNFYLCNGGVIVPEFGDRRGDRAAQDTLARLFPHREIVALNIDALAAGGGGIHCATQQEPQI